MQREIALQRFREGQVKVLVSTNIASRGLDLPPVGHVVQFDMPISLEDFDNYIYRLGRVERGRATSFYVPGREVGVGNDKIYRQLVNLLEEYRQVSFGGRYCPRACIFF